MQCRNDLWGWCEEWPRVIEGRAYDPQCSSPYMGPNDFPEPSWCLGKDLERGDFLDDGAVLYATRVKCPWSKRATGVPSSVPPLSHTGPCKDKAFSLPCNLG